MDNYDAIVDFIVDSTETNSFKIKGKIAGKIQWHKHVKIMTLLKHLSNIWRNYN